jgi:hypothetical protein
MNSIADLYKDPFADMKAAPQPIPDVPVEEPGMSPTEMAGWGAAALGGGLIGRAAYKKVANTLKDSADTVAGMTRNTSFGRGVRKAAEKTKQVIADGQQEVRDGLLRQQLADAKHMGALAGREEAIANVMKEMIFRPKGARKEAVRFDSPRIQQLLAKFGDEWRAGAKGEIDPNTNLPHPGLDNIMTGRGGLTNEELGVIDTYATKNMKNKMSPVDKALLGRLAVHAKAVGGFNDRTGPIITNTDDIGMIHGLYNLLHNKS